MEEKTSDLGNYPTYEEEIALLARIARLRKKGVDVEKARCHHGIDF